MEFNYTQKIKSLIDSLKARCSEAGLGGDGNEYKVITQSFLYKFLNDKFLHDVIIVKPELADVGNLTDALRRMDENEYCLMLAKMGGSSAELLPDHLIPSLFAKQNERDFYKIFNDVLHDIAVRNTGTFSVHTDEGTDVLLFEAELFNIVSDGSKRNTLAKAIINLLAEEKLDFSMAFEQGFDFFSTIFEYMIKDYNANGGGVYAEYYTPRSVARIMADILVDKENVSNVKILDPSAGSGTLLMSIAHKIGPNNCSVYSQDISQKSSNLLRLNLILNNLAHSISHVVEGNTITHPKHMNIVSNSGFDYIVSNPPFKLDFSSYRDEVADNPSNSERFFAGVPTIPKKKKESMAIYLLFIQHIMYSLGEHGKAAVVVPTGFLTAQNGIEYKIRERLVERHWLKGVVSMPSNIFATTGTNVSVIFIDKDAGDKITLVDASKLGKKVKEGKNQRTVLSFDEEKQIVNTFSGDKDVKNFSVHPSREAVKEKGCSLSAGQYFEIKIEHTDISVKEFQSHIDTYERELKNLFSKSSELGRKIMNNFGRLKYE